jgi:hypothetical protein
LGTGIKIRRPGLTKQVSIDADSAVSQALASVKRVFSSPHNNGTAIKLKALFFAIMEKPKDLSMQRALQIIHLD